jgi:hypothetical protein
MEIAVRNGRFRRIYQKRSIANGYIADKMAYLVGPQQIFYPRIPRRIRSIRYANIFKTRLYERGPYLVEPVIRGIMAYRHRPGAVHEKIVVDEMQPSTARLDCAEVSDSAVQEPVTDYSLS